ncbi:hypothetical protein PSV09DRAFT_1032352, partial [Bipolaris maydis]
MESRYEQAAASEKIKDMQARGQAIPSDRGIVVLGDIAVARQLGCTSTNGVADFAGPRHVTFVTFSSSSALGCIDGDWLPPKQKSDLTVAHRDSGDALLRVKVHGRTYISTRRAMWLRRTDSRDDTRPTEAEECLVVDSGTSQPASQPWWAADPASSMSEQDRETKSPLLQRVRVGMTETCSLFAAYVSFTSFADIEKATSIRNQVLADDHATRDLS